MKSMGFGPIGKRACASLRQVLGEQVGPILVPAVHPLKLRVEFLTAVVRRRLECFDHRIEVGDAAERARQRAIERNVDESCSGRADPVAVAVKGAMHQYVTRLCRKAAPVAAFVATPADQQRRIGAQMMVPRKGATGLVPSDFLARKDEWH